jgi:Fe-S cluster biosynthesis and repair protein YggX
MNLQQRIEQFEKMTQADPSNELGHFSLGKAYLDGERFAEAATALRRAIELNANHSAAFALLATAERRRGRNGEALAVLREGYRVAMARGDMIPAREMAAMLTELGEPPAASPAPAVKSASTDGPAGFKCSRCGSPRNAMPDPPMRGPLGARIHASVCAACWREWIGMGTKVINELRLDMTDPRAQQVYNEHLREFLSIS